MTLKFFLRIQIDLNQIELNPVFLSSNRIELKLERIESNRITLKFNSIRFVRNLNTIPGIINSQYQKKIKFINMFAYNKNITEEFGLADLILLIFHVVH